MLLTDRCSSMSLRRRLLGGEELPLFLLLVLLLPAVCVAQTSCGDNSTGANPGICGNNSTCKSTFLCSCEDSFFSPTGSATDCRSVSEPDPRCGVGSMCVYCGMEFNGPCMKCVVAITQSGDCVDSCDDEAAFAINTITIGSFIISARVCDDNSSSDNSALPSWAVALITVLAGVLLLILCVVCTVLSVIYLSRVSSGEFDVEDSEHARAARPGNLRPPSQSSSFGYERQTNDNGHRNSRDSGQFVGLQNPTYSDESSEEAVFMQKLEYLRGQAEIFLKMLNDMRRRLKELPPGAPATQQYRNVMSDITRLLYLLNKKPSAVEMPPDGIQLLTWSEQILHRYLASRGQAPRGPPQQQSNQRQPNRLSHIGPQEETRF